MKKITFLGALVISLGIQAQTFTDNFDSYTAGSYLGPQSGGEWTTWSDSPGSNEDVKVYADATAPSQSNSLHFVSTTSGGGPTDLVREFSNAALSTGQFTMSMNLKVTTGATGYFNLQKTMTIGQTWALDASFLEDGSLSFVNQSGLNFNTTYPNGQWFNFRLEVNFNTNVWELFIDDVSAGTFSNPENQIASIDIFPVDQTAPYNSDFYIDDFSTTIVPYTLPNLNAAVTLVSYTGVGFPGSTVTPSIRIKNLGVDAITSFDIEGTYNGTTINESFPGLNLASKAELSLDLTTDLTLIAGSNDFVVTVSNVNENGADDDATDDEGVKSITPIVPATGKMVLGEEGTGTWCQWCPRGAVFMDMMENRYGNYWAGIAVHNGDPMTVTQYDAGMGSLISGYPSALVDRGSSMDPSVMEPVFLEQIQIDPIAVLTNGATWDAGTRELTVSISSNFKADATNEYKIACVLTEDGVTGGSGYAQSNAYANGTNGAMGGYESLPNPVPAAQMVYDHVARAIVPSFEGMENSFPAVVTNGETHTVNFKFTLPVTWDENKLHIIGMLLDSNGKVDNAGKATITEAVSNGFVSGAWAAISENEMTQIDATFQLYPNPATTAAVVGVNLKDQSNVSLRILDLSGKELSSRNYGTMTGASTITMNTASFQSGIYLVELTVNGETLTKRLVIQ
jgi:hypothetical protein